MDYLVYFLITIILIIGIYQFYFWTQKNSFREAREFKATRIDAFFQMRPGWVYVYSGLYYPVIVLLIYVVQDMRQFNYMAISFFMLMLMQMAFFILVPVVTPHHWRELPKTKSVSVRFLKLVQSIDARSNCFPSMHVSVATLTSLHLIYNAPFLAPWAWIFPLLIALSALYTKQHYFYDLAPGAVLGWVAFKGFQWMWA
jgi:membrane-associated phospholipid phosphatase